MVPSILNNKIHFRIVKDIVVLVGKHFAGTDNARRKLQAVNVFYSRMNAGCTCRLSCSKTNYQNIKSKMTKKNKQNPKALGRSISPRGQGVVLAVRS